MSNARNISKADSRFVNATGDTMSGALTGQSSISCKPALTVHGASTSSVPEVRLDMVNYSGSAGDLQGGIVWVGGDASTPGYDTERARIDATLTDQYNRVGLSFKVGAYSNPVPYEVMRLDAHGRVTTPYQPSFMAYAGGDVGFSAPQSTWADLNVFGSVNHNRGNHYNSSTCNFTCPVGGIYHFYVNVREETYYGSWGGIHIQLVTNGSRFAEIRKWDGYQNEETLALSVTREFSANDVVGVRVHSDSSDTNLSVEGGNTTFFGGYLLG